MSIEVFLEAKGKGEHEQGSADERAERAGPHDAL